MESSKDQSAAEFYSDEKHIEMWKVKRLIKKLDNTKGNGTSFVSLYIPQKDNLAKINQMLVEELSGASQIKSRQTRQSVQSAITSTKESKCAPLSPCRTEAVQEHPRERPRAFLRRDHDGGRQEREEDHH